METPKNGRQLRPVRNPTPRLSERKKSLFASSALKGKNSDEDDDPLHGIRPLDSSLDEPNVKMQLTTPKSNKNRLKEASSTRRSLRLDQKYSSPSSNKDGASTSTSHALLSLTTPEKNDKENIPVQSRSEEGADDQLQLLFSASMRLNIDTANTDLEIEETSDEEGNECKNQDLYSRADKHKRHYDQSSPSTSCPQRKVAKLSSPKLDSIFISTKSFYSTATAVVPKISPKGTLSSIASTSQANSTSPKTRRSERRSDKPSINNGKGVRHRIRRRPRPPGSALRHFAPVDVDLILSNVRNEKLRHLIISKREERKQIDKVHNIFRNSRNPIAMARPLTTLCNADDDDSNNNNNIISVNKQTPTRETDFSDLEFESEDEEISAFSRQHFSLANGGFVDNDEIIPLISHQQDTFCGSSGSPIKSTDEMRSATPTANRKFFKSARSTSTRMEVKITDNIRASVCNGKISLVQEKGRGRKRSKLRTSVANEFSDEQATVDAILKNLDDTAFGDILDASAHADTGKELTKITNEGQLLETIQLEDATDYAEFRKRLPYNTDDSETIEQQHLLLDFLISNNICTEHNFNIFIADPDNHKEEASRIVDQVIVVVNEDPIDFRQRLPYKTSDPEIIAQQHRFIDFLIEHNLCTENNFDVFIANYEQRHLEAEAIMSSIQFSLVENSDGMESCALGETAGSFPAPVLMSSTFQENEQLQTLQNSCIEKTATPEKLFPIFYADRCQPLVQQSTRRLPQRERTWVGGQGAYQYQIDAGQRNFGAQQCKQCGLVYSVHEPEEEKLHRDYHASLHVLRFKGWIDEDIVSIFPEWGADGRILRITETSHIKRRERLMDILKIVDKELGFSSYIIPKIFVAYFAVRKYQIVGVCLVQPLETANKYLCINGVDCCTQEKFEAKCGISRIWVSPLHRRLRIGSKLIQAVQLNTIFGEEIPLNKIAFSAPTENGKSFAQKVTQIDNFLVYQ